MRRNHVSFFAGLAFAVFLSGCSGPSSKNENGQNDAALKTVNDYDEALFNLYSKVRILDKTKVKCVVSVDTTDLQLDIGEVATARLTYFLVRDVSIPVSGTDVEENIYVWYIASYDTCDEALSLTTDLIKAENPKVFPPVKIEGPEALDFLKNTYR